MTAVESPQLNPEIPTDSPPTTPNEQFQQFQRQKGVILRVESALAEGPHDPFADKTPKAVLRIFRRIPRSRFPAKRYLYKFLCHKYRQNCKQRTLSSYCTSIRFFLTFVAARGKEKIDQLTRDDLEAFVEHEQDRGMQPNTIYHRLIHIYAFLQYLVDHEMLLANLLLRKLKVKVPDPLPKAMDPIDVTRLLSVIDNTRDRAMILVMLRTGMRIGELLNLKMADVRLSEQKILIWEGEKNATGRSVCLSTDAAGALSQWISLRDPEKENIFYARGRHSMGYTASRKMFIKYLTRAGLSAKGYCLHSLRHTFATDLLNAGMRLECLQQLLGHSSLEMTLRYARLSNKTREKEYFKAMAVIEGDLSDEPDRFDCPLPAPPEAAELLGAHDPKLHQ